MWKRWSSAQSTLPPRSLRLGALLGAVILTTERVSEFPAKFQSRGWIEREIHIVEGKGERGKGRGRYVISSLSAAERRAREVTCIGSGWLLLEASQGPKLGRKVRCCSKRDTQPTGKSPRGEAEEEHPLQHTAPAHGIFHFEAPSLPTCASASLLHVSKGTHPFLGHLLPQTGIPLCLPGLRPLGGIPAPPPLMLLHLCLPWGCCPLPASVGVPHEQALNSPRPLAGTRFPLAVLEVASLGRASLCRSRAAKAFFYFIKERKNKMQKLVETEDLVASAVSPLCAEPFVPSVP